MSDIRVPELGESIVEATVLTWLKQAGDPVQSGDAVVELETDKVNVEIMAEESGVLESILKQSGDTVRVGESVGVIGAGSVNSSEHQALPINIPRLEQEESPLRPTPSMRRLAREQGIDPEKSTNVVKHTPMAQSPETTRVPTVEAVKVDRADEERQRMTRRRLTIAKRLVEAQHTAAMLTTFNEVDMTRVMEVRARRKDRFRVEHGVSLGFMSFFTKATVAALKVFPRLNAEIQGEDMILKHHYDIGVAVSTEGGLVVPVVRDAERLSFSEIEREIAGLAEKARDNTLGLGDLQGGTFTITNGGVFGSLFSTPILNAPQVGILGMHGIKERPVAVDGRVEIRPMMYVALSYDHRIVDGSEAVRFLAMVKTLIEDPETLLLEG